MEPYAEAARTWPHAEAEVVDTTHLTPAQAAERIARAAASPADGPSGGCAVPPRAAPAGSLGTDDTAATDRLT